MHYAARGRVSLRVHRDMVGLYPDDYGPNTLFRDDPVAHTAYIPKKCCFFTIWLGTHNFGKRIHLTGRGLPGRPRFYAIRPMGMPPP